MTQPQLATLAQISLGFISGRVPVLGDSDLTGLVNFFSGVYRDHDIFRQGKVVAYHPQTHSAAVRISGTQGEIWACTFSDELLSYSYGYSETHPARESECVLVVEVAPEAKAGIIIGRIPYPLLFAPDAYNDPDGYHRRLYTQLKETGDRDIRCFATPFVDENDDTTHIATHFRPTDVYPGEFARINQHNCGIKGGLFSATLLGGGASLRLSGLSNSARLTCDAYKRFSMLGNMHEFHNGRYLSSERDVAMYQEERLGGNYVKDRVWTEDSEAPRGGENQTIRPRVKELSGYFGHLVSKFCLRPDQSASGLRVLGESKPVEEGVSRETIDPSGQYRLSAAGMIAIERTGRIPVPVRTCYPTDKDHDISEEPLTLEPFKHNLEDPNYRQLELFDRQAYDLKNQYSRMDGLDKEGNPRNPDYDVPDEEDMRPLGNMYDEHFTKSNTVELKNYDRRRAGIYIGEDGSVIIRDAWGSEIVMLGGNITMSCAGNVMILPGMTSLTIAGDDIVQKARNSVDIHASEHDVRLSAARNMEILGGGDEKTYSGGVIIESRGNGTGPWDGEGKGEGAKLSGITLKARNQAVVVDGKVVNVRSKTKTRIVSGDGKIDGDVSVAAKTFRSRASKNIVSAGDTAISVSSGSVTAVGDRIDLYSGSSFEVTRGSEIPVPIKWNKTENNMAERTGPQIEREVSDLGDDKSASLDFDRSALDKMKFGFRSASECGTDRSWSIGGPDRFRMYEPAWAQILKVYETLSKIGAEEYSENAEWENGMPFPGADSTADYARLAGDRPQNLTEEGFNARRKNVKFESKIDLVSLIEGYLVRKQ